MTRVLWGETEETDREQWMRKAKNDERGGRLARAVNIFGLSYPSRHSFPPTFLLHIPPHTVVVLFSFNSFCLLHIVLSNEKSEFFSARSRVASLPYLSSLSLPSFPPYFFRSESTYLSLQTSSLIRSFLFPCVVAHCRWLFYRSCRRSIGPTSRCSLFSRLRPYIFSVVPSSCTSPCIDNISTIPEQLTAGPKW